jgi:DnaK suppressor protein
MTEEDTMPLHKRQKDELEQIMRERRARLVAELQSDVAKSRELHYQELVGGPGDAADEAAADLLADIDNAETSRDIAELREIDAALARISEQHYGVCTDCRSEIVLERLSAQPTAVRCFPCERLHEKTYAQPTRATL